MSDLAVAPPRRSMGIKNLIPSLPERGKIKIGIKGQEITSQRGNKFQPPQKLDHFVVTTLQRGQDNNYLRDEAFHAKYGPAPTTIPVRLLYDDPLLNYPTRYACFIGRALWCSGDGESATRLTTTPADLKNPDNIRPREVPCTCERQEPTYKGGDRCKINGNLSVLIDGMGGVGGVWRFRTTSYNSVVGIMSSMAFIRSVTGGVLANIPLQLRVAPKQVTSPVDGRQQTIYVVNLEFEGNISELQEIGHTIALERAKTHVSIAHIEDEARRVLALAPPANAPLPGDEPDDIVEEFYPEQIVPTEAATAPPRPRREDYADDPQVDGETGEIRDAVEAAAEETDPETGIYWVMNFEGVEIECLNAAEADKLLTEIFADAKRRGRVAMEAAVESNLTAFRGLRADGFGDMVDRLAAFHTEAMKEFADDPVASPTTERRRTKRTQAPNTDESSVTRVTEPASQQGTEASPPPHSKTAERPGPTVFPIGSGRGDPQPDSPAVGSLPVEERSGAATERGAAAPERPMTEEPSRASLWREASFYIEPPLLPNTARVNFPILRDMLCNLARDAQTRDEIGKFEADNQPNLRRLIEAFPQYGEQAVRAIADAKQRIGNGT